MPDENRVFDISKPGSTNAHPAGKPVIVGHHPAASDPMMKTDSASSAVAPTHILVQDSGQHSEHDVMSKPAEHAVDTSPSIFAPATPDFHPLEAEPVHTPFNEEPSPNQDSNHVEPPTDQELHVDTSAVTNDFAGDENPDKGAPNSYSATTDPQMPEGHLGHVEGIHLPPHKSGHKVTKSLLILILLGVAGYLFIDSGVVNTGINLPYHIFKQKAKVVSVTVNPPATPPAAQATVIPNGFSQYKITGTPVTFAAPTAWGKPTSTTDKGFTSRSSDSQADSNYAYLVDFPDNKNVELAVTSAKYLPPARATLYYDYLQWCTGSSDGKYYFSVLKFTTTNKVDTPSTIVCDQGPLNNPTKLDDTTIVQIGLKDTAGGSVGDVYTKNLSSKDLPVLRVKDGTASNSDDIKKLLNTVKEQS